MIRKLLLAVLPWSIIVMIKKRKWEKELEHWKNNGRPVPPPHVIKQSIIKDYQKRFGHKVLIETGTLNGDMIEAQKNDFEKLYSVELADHLYEKAKKRFKKDNRITIVHGDSGVVMPDVLKEISEPAIFWLDGHYSAGETAKGEKLCPIYKEMDAIFDHNFDHVILVDDAWSFTGSSDYPTIDELTAYVQGKNSKYKVEVENNIIRYTAGN